MEKINWINGQSGGTPLSAENLNLMQDNAENAINESKVPTGSIVSYGGLNAPSNWLICDGSAISRTEYAELYSVLGTTYGAGDGSTTFNLPDLRDKFILGSSNSHISGETGGEEEHTLTIDEMPSHNHEFKRTGAYGTSSNHTGMINEMGATNYENLNTKSTGGGQPHNNMPPYVAIMFIIKAK